MQQSNCDGKCFTIHVCGKVEIQLADMNATHYISCSRGQYQCSGGISVSKTLALPFGDDVWVLLFGFGEGNIFLKCVNLKHEMCEQNLHVDFSFSS